MADEDYRRLSAACGCGNALPAYRGRGAPPKYCGEGCRPNYSARYYKSRPLKRVACTSCGIEVETKSGGLKRCQPCRKKRAAAMAPVARNCAHCGEAFIPRINAGKFCGERCRVSAGNKAQAERLAATKAAEPARRCAWCSSEFQRTYGDGRRRYCSAQCETARQNRARSGSTHRRRAKRFGVSFEPVDRIKVFARDRWRCQICARKVTKDEAELDHIVPMSKGGPHSYANTQCTCKQCNRAKGNKELGQQLLFG